MRRFILFFIGIIIVSLSFGQTTYTMSSSPVTTCSGTYYDPGGTGDYSNNTGITQTFTPGTAGQMLRFTFTSFSTESGYDYIDIYDGPDDSYPLIGEYDGTSSPGTITATQTGQLTFYFYSDDGVVSSGWQATISCVAPSNNALDFREGDFVSINTGSASLSGTFTVECWANCSATDDVYSICGSRYPNDYSFDMKFNNGTIHGDIGNGSSWITTAADVTYAYSANTWYHIAYVVTPTSWTLYVHNTSGTLVAYNTGTYASNSPLLFDASHTLALGDISIDETSEYLNGGIDEFRIWNRALTQEDIQTSIFSEVCSSASGLLACYHFNEGIACGDNYTYTLIDVGPNNYYGTMHYFDEYDGECTSNWCNGVSAITGTSCPAAYKAQFVSMNLGSNSWCAGESRSVTVTVKNVGTATWTDASPDINVGIKWNSNSSNWTDYWYRQNAGTVAPGQTATYTFSNMQASNASALGTIPNPPTYGTNLANGTNNITFDLVSQGNFWFANQGNGSTVFTSPNQTINTTVPSTPNAISPSNPSVCVGGTVSLSSADPASCTGCTKTVSGNYNIIKYTSNGTFSSSPSPLLVDVLVVGGGGAGGGSQSSNGGGGGGGAGGVIYTKAFSAANGCTVTVGGGGTGVSNNRGNSGNNSVFSTITATGGGGGGGGGGTNPAGNTGGSGGGAGYNGYIYSSAGNGTLGQGNSGSQNGSDNAGNLNPPPSGAGGGSGGGASSAGNVPTNSPLHNGGVGGSGMVSGITGTTYAAGGNGGGTSGTAGAANTGNGGAGVYAAGNSCVGYAGGSGVIEVRYPRGVWSSDNTGIASVDASTGLVTGVSIGSTTIRYTVTNSCGNTSSVSANVQVLAKPSSVSVSPSSSTKCQGDNITLTATGNPSLNWKDASIWDFINGTAPTWDATKGAWKFTGPCWMYLKNQYAPAINSANSYRIDVEIYRESASAGNCFYWGGRQGKKRLFTS